MQDKYDLSLGFAVVSNRTRVKCNFVLVVSKPTTVCLCLSWKCYTAIWKGNTFIQTYQGFPAKSQSRGHPELSVDA